jgi:branched-chain amino acid transport system substrate-binding protein
MRRSANWVARPRHTDSAGQAGARPRGHSRLRYGLIAASAIPVVLAAACSSSAAAGGGSPSSSASSGSILVGAVAAESGTFGAYGTADVKGMQAQIDLINASGGVLGHQLKLDAIDDQSDPSKAGVAAQQLLSGSQVPLLIHAGAVSVDAAPVIAVTTRAKVITMTPAATPAFEDPKQDPYDFVVFPSSDLQVTATAAGLKQLIPGDTKVGLLSSNDTGGQAIIQAMQQGLPAAGLKVVGSQSVSDTATDMTPQLQALKSAGAQILFLQFASPAQFVTAMDDIQTMGWKSVRALAGTTAIAATTMTAIPAAVTTQFAALGTLSLSRSGSGSGASLQPKIQSFVNELSKIGGNTALLLESLNGADEINLLVWAINHAHSIQPAAVYAALNDTASTPVPSSQLFQVPPPAWSNTNHGLAGANFSNYWALLSPGAPLEGTYKGQVIPLTS